MRKVVSTTKNMTVDELIDLLNTDPKVIVFYNSSSSSNNESYPVFLNKVPSSSKYAFFPPIYGYSPTYISQNLRECLESAIKGGKGLFVVERDKVSEIFKKQSS